MNTKTNFAGPILIARKIRRRMFGILKVSASRLIDGVLGGAPEVQIPDRASLPRRLHAWRCPETQNSKLKTQNSKLNFRASSFDDLETQVDLPLSR
jgi:hypothetical protein